MGFSPDVVKKALTSCGRRCVICHEFCGTKMELHHIKQVADGGDDSFENCIPLCLNCHADVKAYNPRHPIGRQYTEGELKTHRDLWYNKCATKKEVSDEQDLPVLPKQKMGKKIVVPVQKSEKEISLEDIDEQFFVDEYSDLVTDVQRIKKTIGSYEWKIIKAILKITDYGLAWNGARTTMVDLLFELGASKDYIDNELSNLVRMGYISLDEDEIMIQGKARGIIDLANKVAEKLDPDIYPDEMFGNIMQELIP